MEQITAEQAEPQGSAAPEQAASAPDFGAIFRAHVFKEAPDSAAMQSGASSADPETSADDEQPGPQGASADGDGTAADATRPATDQPRLSRSQRKALKQADAPGAQPTATADTSAQPTTTSPAPAGDPVERVERAVTEGLSRLESLIRAPNPSQSDPTLDSASRQYTQTFGDDNEFGRRALVATRPSGDVYLSAEEAAELERWSVNREIKQQIDGNYQRNLAAVAVQKAQAHGIDPQSVLSRPQFADTFDVFLEHGKSLGIKEAESKVAARLSKLEAANRQLADENEALRARAPGLARSVLTGGVSSSSRAAALGDRQTMSGRDLMRSGISQGAAPRRPGGRS